MDRILPEFRVDPVPVPRENDSSALPAERGATSSARGAAGCFKIHVAGRESEWKSEGKKRRTNVKGYEPSGIPTIRRGAHRSEEEQKKNDGLHNGGSRRWIFRMGPLTVAFSAAAEIDTDPKR